MFNNLSTQSNNYICYILAINLHIIQANAVQLVPVINSIRYHIEGGLCLCIDMFTYIYISRARARVCVDAWLLAFPVPLKDVHHYLLKLGSTETSDSSFVQRKEI